MNRIGTDLGHVVTHVGTAWEQLRGARLFVTGGTGFFGTWILDTFASANRLLDLSASALVLSRDPDAFARREPRLASDPAIAFHVGDVRSFDFPEGRFTHIIHAATTASASLNDGDPVLMFDTIVAGTRRVLDFAVASGARSFLFTSSGAVYGRQPAEVTHVPEDYCGGPDPLSPNSAYAEGKRAAELLCRIWSDRHGIEAKIARCFAFVGPGLQLDAHFAIGNFIRDALRGGPIVVEGDGTPVRSYLYAADLAIWLWRILTTGTTCRPYNVGSEQSASIASVATAVAAAIDPKLPIELRRRPFAGVRVEQYVPCTDRARTELGLAEYVPLGEAVYRTAWCARREHAT